MRWQQSQLICAKYWYHTCVSLLFMSAFIQNLWIVSNNYALIHVFIPFYDTDRKMLLKFKPKKCNYMYTETKILFWWTLWWHWWYLFTLIASDNGLFPGGTKPSPEPTLNYGQRDYEAFARWKICSHFAGAMTNNISVLAFYLCKASLA